MLLRLSSSTGISDCTDTFSPGANIHPDVQQSDYRFICIFTFPSRGTNRDRFDPVNLHDIS